MLAYQPGLAEEVAAKHEMTSALFAPLEKWVKEDGEPAENKPQVEDAASTRHTHRRTCSLTSTTQGLQAILPKLRGFLQVDSEDIFNNCDDLSSRREGWVGVDSHVGEGAIA